MWNAIGGVLTDLWANSYDRRVATWLNKATKESVLESLTSALFSGGKGYGGLPNIRDTEVFIKNTFDAYGSVDESRHIRYWYEKDFAFFLSSRFRSPALAASIPILWRSFHFYGFFPFQEDLQRLDYNAFQRAIGMLAARGDRLLGMDADGRIIGEGEDTDTDFRASHRLRLIFRSFSICPFDGGEAESSRFPSLLSRTEDDVVDVMLLAMPCDPCMAPPSRESVKPHAQRVALSARHIDFLIPRKDLRALLRFLLSIESDPPERFRSFQTAHAAPGFNVDVLDGASDALLRRVAPNEDSDVKWLDFKSVVDVYLPKFAYQLRLVFSAFLSPSSKTDQSLKISPSISTLPGPYAQGLSLCLHPSLAHLGHKHAGAAYLECCYALQVTKAFYLASHGSFSITDFIDTLLPIKTATLLLLTGEVITTKDSSHPDHSPSTRAAFGALVPTSWDLQRQRGCLASPSVGWHTYAPAHMLFQLEPRFEILRPNEGAKIMDLISVTKTDVKRATKGGLRFGTENSSGLSIDLDTEVASIRSVGLIGVDVGKGKEQTDIAYRDISPEAGIQAGEWSSSMKIQKLEIYDLEDTVVESP